MTPSLRQMLFEQNYERAAAAERERILAITKCGLDVGKFEQAVALVRDPTMTVEMAAEILGATT